MAPDTQDVFAMTFNCTSMTAAEVVARLENVTGARNDAFIVVNVGPPEQIETADGFRTVCNLTIGVTDAQASNALAALPPQTLAEAGVENLTLAASGDAVRASPKGGDCWFTPKVGWCFGLLLAAAIAVLLLVAAIVYWRRTQAARGSRDVIGKFSGAKHTRHFNAVDDAIDATELLTVPAACDGLLADPLLGSTRLVPASTTIDIGSLDVGITSEQLPVVYEPPTTAPAVADVFEVKRSGVQPDENDSAPAALAGILSDPLLGGGAAGETALQSVVTPLPVDYRGTASDASAVTEAGVVSDAVGQVEQPVLF